MLYAEKSVLHYCVQFLQIRSHFRRASKAPSQQGVRQQGNITVMLFLRFISWYVWLATCDRVTAVYEPLSLLL